MRPSVIAAGLFVTAGALHFLRPQLYAKIVPPALGHEAELVAISGLAEIAGGLGLLHPRTRRASGYGLILLLLAVWPANIFMALDDLRALFAGDADPHDQLAAAYQHDWQRDPYARGAYSYALVGGAHAREALTDPIDERIFLAGEATASAAESGTVAGALQSGARAAAQVLARYDLSG